MKIISYCHQGVKHFGIVVGDGVVQADGKVGDVRSIKQLLQKGRLDELRALEALQPDALLQDIDYECPVPDADKIICVGVNYANRNAEYKDGSEAPKYPSLFPRFASSFTSHNRSLIRPPESHQLDYEGEIVLVIGKGGRRIQRETAYSHIAGLTLANEGTLRDWVRHAKFNVTQGKNFDSSGSIGPWMISADEVEDFNNLQILTRVNGAVRQNDKTSSMAFPIDFLISYISTFTTLNPGDLILSGTPTGAGARFDPPKYLEPGDVVEVECPAIGILRNTIADEQCP